MKAKFTDNKRKWFRRILGMAGIIAVLCLTSCSNFIEEEKLNVVKVVKPNAEVKPDKEGYVTLYIAVSEDSFRATYHPEVTGSGAFDSFSLLCDGAQLGFWQTGDGLNAYDVMRIEPVRVKPGNYNFELIADKGGVKYSETKSAVITGSDNIIEFSLKFLGVSTGSNGTERINITFPSSASKLVIERYKYEDVTSRIISDAEPVVTTVTSFTASGNGLKYSPADASYAPGKYKYVFSFYASGISEPILSIPHIVYISADQQTYVAFDIADFTEVYEITYFNTNGVSYTGDVPLVYAGGTAITLPVPEKAHYVFGGWYEDEDFSGTAVTGWTAGAKSGNVTLYAKWTPETYTVSFYSAVNADGSYSATAFATQNVSYNEYAVAPAAAPERSGYTFERWITDGESTAFSFESTKITKDTKLYAIWKNSANNKVSYPVYFYYDDDTIYTVQNVVDGQTASAPGTALTKEECVFRGWYAESNKNSKNPAQVYDFDTPVTSVLRLYASWCRTTYHISETGADTYNGSATSPVATLKKALRMIEGDIYDTSAYHLDYSSFTGNLDFTLVIHGNVVDTEDIVLLTDSHTASLINFANVNSLTIKGASGSASDSISGNRFYIQTDVPVTFTDIKENFSELYVGDEDPAASVTYDSGIICTSLTTVYNGNLVMEAGAELTGAVMLYSGTYNKSVSFTMNGGIIHNCTGDPSSSNGGGVYNSGIFTMNNGIISSNTNSNGGGVYNSGTFTMNGGEISGNTAVCGGGVCNAGTFYFNGGKIRNNTAKSYYEGTNVAATRYLSAYGGGIYNSGTISFYDAGTGKEISNNNAIAYLKIIASKSQSKFYLRAYGGGIYSTSYIDLKYVGISGNTLETTVDGSYYYASNIKEREIKGAAIYSRSDAEAGTAVLALRPSVSIPSDVIPQTIYIEGNKYVELWHASNSSDIGSFEFESLVKDRRAFLLKASTNYAAILGRVRIANDGWYVYSDGLLTNTPGGTAYDITYLDQGGEEFSGTHIKGYPKKCYSDKTVYLDTPAKLHYNFGGWYLSSDGGASLVTQKTSIANATTAVTLYAKWTPKTSYNITYCDAGGTAYSGTNEGELPSNKYQGETEVLPDGVKPGFAFGGWYANSGCTGSPVTTLVTDSAVTLYAKWIRESWTVSYSSAVEDYTAASSLPETRTPGTTVAVPTVSKTGYVFVGWYLNPEFTGAKVTRLTDDRTPGDVTLYAKWKPHYSITYKDFGGDDLSGTAEATRPSYRNEGETYTLPNATKEGYVFMGWYTASNTLIAKLDDTTCTSDMTLYAKWKEGSESVNITIDQGDVTITKTEEDGVVILIAADGFTNYTWTVFDKAPSEFAGFALSADGKTLTVTKAELLEGFGYEVKVLAYKNGMPYQTFTTVTK